MLCCCTWYEVCKSAFIYTMLLYSSQKAGTYSILTYIMSLNISLDTWTRRVWHRAYKMQGVLKAMCYDYNKRLEWVSEWVSGWVGEWEEGCVCVCVCGGGGGGGGGGGECECVSECVSEYASLIWTRKHNVFMEVTDVGMNFRAYVGCNLFITKPLPYIDNHQPLLCYQYGWYFLRSKRRQPQTTVPWASWWRDDLFCNAKYPERQKGTKQRAIKLRTLVTL